MSDNIFQGLQIDPMEIQNTDIIKRSLKNKQKEIEVNNNKNSYPDTDKNKLAGIEDGAEVNNLTDTQATALISGSVTSLHTHNYILGSTDYSHLVGSYGIIQSSTTPSSPYTGMLWNDTSVVTRTYIQRYDGSNWIVIYSAEHANRTVTVTNNATDSWNDTGYSDLAQAINAKISQIGKHFISTGANYIDSEITVTLHFSDGTYTLSTKLVISGFYGYGKLLILGNSSDNSLSTSKNVVLDFSGQDTDGIIIRGNSLRFIGVHYLKIKIKTDVGGYKGIGLYGTSSYCFAYYNYIKGTSTAHGDAISSTYGSSLLLHLTYVDNIKHGIRSYYGSDVYSLSNDDTGTKPLYGLRASGGTIRKNGTQPAGSLTNELIDAGGQII